MIRAPSKPGRPVAICYRGIYVIVKWTEPEDDGGAEVTGYIIKYLGGMHSSVQLSLTGSDSDSDTDSDTDDDEYRKLSVVGNTTNFHFTDQLRESTPYQFAVAAVNTDGRGEFSEFTDYVNTMAGKHCCQSHVKCCELM